VGKGKAGGMGRNINEDTKNLGNLAGNRGGHVGGGGDDDGVAFWLVMIDHDEEFALLAII